VAAAPRSSTTRSHGFDHRRGGLYRSDVVAPPADPTENVWWVQAEMLAALTAAVAGRKDPGDAVALAQLLRFVRRHQSDRTDGVWLHAVSAPGRRRNPRKSDVTKSGYHEIRALVKVVDTFS